MLLDKYAMVVFTRLQGLVAAGNKEAVTETFVSCKGVMAGGGEIWFTQSDELKYRYGISAINK